MPKGVRLLTPEEEQRLLSMAELRDRLTDKALARQFGLTAAQVTEILRRLREQRRQNTENCGLGQSA